MDQQVIRGQLDNGLKYYVVRNNYPKDKVYIRLVVNAGSLNEDDDQKGVAHIVEHLAFNGSKKYPENQIIDVLESLGMKFARDINAFTDFENTVYTLDLKNNQRQNIQTALDVVDEWLNNLTILEEDLNAERGIVLEEWRARLSPMLRLGDKKSLVEMANSRYAERDPIGDVQVIKYVPRQRVYDFYKKWYRPDNAAIIVVGDVDPAQIITLIKQKFNPVPKPNIPLETVNYNVPIVNQWRVASVSEKNMNTPSVEMSFFEPMKPATTIAEYKQELIQKILMRTLNVRLQEWESTHNKLIETSNFYKDNLGRETLQWIFVLHLKPQDFKPDHYDQVTRLLFKFIAEIEQHGLQEKEVQSAIQHMAYLNEKKDHLQLGSRQVANGLVPVAAMDDISVSLQDQYGLNKRLLSNISVKDINQAFRQIVTSPAKLLMLNQPPIYPRKTLNLAQVKSQWQQAQNTQQHPWRIQKQQEKAGIFALENYQVKSKEGGLQQIKAWDDMGMIEYRLSNGNRLVYHYSDKDPGKVHFSALTDGGLRSVPNEDYHLLRAAVSVVDDTGIGELPFDQVFKSFNKSPIAFVTLMDESRQGFSTMSSKKDFESILKLLHLKLASSPVSEKVLQEYKENEKVYTNQDKETEFMQKVGALRYPNKETVYSKRKPSLDQLNTQQLSQIYAKYVRAKTDFTYFIVGDIPQKEVEKLAKKYLATIEVKSQKRQFHPLIIHTPNHPFTLKGQLEPRADVELYLTAVNRFKPENKYLLDVLGTYLQERLRLTLREKASGVYSVGSWFTQDLRSPQIEGKISFSCDPARAQELLQITQQELDKILQQGIDPVLFAKNRQENKRLLEAEFNSVLAVKNMIESSYRIQGNPNLLYQVTQFDKLVTLEKLNQMSQKILDKSGRFTAILTQ